MKVKKNAADIKSIKETINTTMNLFSLMYNIGSGNEKQDKFIGESSQSFSL